MYKKIIKIIFGAVKSELSKQNSHVTHVRVTWSMLELLLVILNFSPYSFDKYGQPLNPMGRTGLRGRGVLGAWGPCHAADAIISRFRPGTRILEAVLVRRKDNSTTFTLLIFTMGLKALICTDY